MVSLKNFFPKITLWIESSVISSIGYYFKVSTRCQGFYANYSAETFMFQLMLVLSFFRWQQVKIRVMNSLNNC